MTSARADQNPVGDVVVSRPDQVQGALPSRILTATHDGAAIQYLDCAIWRKAYVQTIADQPFWYLWVESITPGTPPDETVVGTTPADDIMYWWPGSTPLPEIVHPNRPVLAYKLTAAGQLWICRK